VHAVLLKKRSDGLSFERDVLRGMETEQNLPVNKPIPPKIPELDE
jgi:hypothetical protein